jgi:hypothetical protein
MRAFDQASPVRAPFTMPAPQPCSVLIPGVEVTNSETAGGTSFQSAVEIFNTE